MKKNLLTGLIAVLVAVACFAQKPYKVVFYNFENLFDTINDPGVKTRSLRTVERCVSSMRRNWAISNACCSTLRPRTGISRW